MRDVGMVYVWAHGELLALFECFFIVVVESQCTSIVFGVRHSHTEPRGLPLFHTTLPEARAHR